MVSARSYRTRDKPAPPGATDEKRRRCARCRVWRAPDAYSWTPKECDPCVEKRAADLRELWALKWSTTKTQPRGSRADVGPSRAACAKRAAERKTEHAKTDRRRSAARDRMRRLRERRRAERAEVA